MAQMVAEEMGLPIEAVTIATGDTDTAPYADMSTGSRTAYSLGMAVVEACRDAKAQLIRRAAKHLDRDEREIEYSNGRFRVKGDPDKSVTLAKVARSSLFSPGEGPVVGRGSVGMPPFAPMIAVHAAEVDVDRETGKVKVLSYIAAQDVGKAINPMLVEGQIQGAVAQGIGWALMEDYIFDKGVMQNTTLLDYRMPTAADVPAVETVLVEVGSDRRSLRDEGCRRASDDTGHGRHCECHSQRNRRENQGSADDARSGPEITQGTVGAILILHE